MTKDHGKKDVEKTGDSRLQRESKYSLDGVRIDRSRDEHTFTRFFGAAEKYPDRPALIFLGAKFSFRRLREMVDKFASALCQLGVGFQDRVLLYLSNSPQWVVANFAIQRMGAVVVPVSPIYTAYELEYMVEDAGVQTIICQDTNFGYVHEVMERTNLKRVILTTLTEFLPTWKVVLGHMLDRIPRGKVSRGKDIHRFGDLLKGGPASPPEVEIDPWRDLCHIMYTGGTTGFPKGVPSNHMTEVSYIGDLIEDILRPRIGEGDDSILMVNPLYHIMAKGFMIGAGLNLGNTTVLMPVPNIDAMLREIERRRVRWLLGVPSLYRMVLESDRVDNYRLDSLRYCFCGGDVLPGEVLNRWKARTGVPIYQVYGSTEVGHVAYSPLDEDPQATVIGKPLKSYRYRLVDWATLEPVPTAETGELLVTSDANIKCYWNKPAETAAAFVKIGSEVYYRTGDFMTLTEKNELQFMERTADVIKYKGYRVAASEIEAVLLDNQVVVGACVVGVPDESVGERIKAIVVLKSDARGVSGNDLNKWCRERLAPYKVPHYIEFRDMLPKSKVGKLLRREIREEERRKLGKTKPGKV
ncbi:MAG TPA: AMP-binding protein [Syntrophobacteraceae bacterium]|nr:AMP-binding protein [Syntrophobacteraceae bacterium]